MHYVLQQLDFKHVSQAGLQAQLDAMVKKDMLTAVEAASIDSRKIMEFFASALGQRILQARRVFREVGFNQLVEAGQILEDSPAPREKLLLQGVIDLYFEEEGGLVVVDYKTDRITPQNRLVLIEQYRAQVEAYCRALEAISGQMVKEGYIYFFAVPEEVRVI
jgi:ATP-dependent helicase/nuclease subunit A